MPRKSAVLANDALLLLTAAIWGFAFVAQRAGMEHVGPFWFTAVRFALGSLSLLPLVLLRRRSARRAAGKAVQSAAGKTAAVGLASAGAKATSPPRLRVLPAGLLAGAVLFGGAALQQVGMVWTTAGKAGFITGLYVVLVPLVGLFWGERAGWPRWLAALLAAAGLFFLTVTRSLTLERGDLFVLAGALFWTAHVRLLGWLSPRTDPLALSCVQFAVCALSSAVAAALSEPLALAALLAAGLPILYGGLLSVGVAYTLQVVAQRCAPPAHAAVFLSLETVFAALGGALVLGERLGPRGLLGCALMFAGMICSQLPLLLGAERPAPPRQIQ
ncbi:MAG: DMT family transporter [Spirochaetes bacterium]|nr:DMT family transporter [Spirochaetota bacterium]